MNKFFHSAREWSARGPVVHPFLFALFPGLFLWAQNVAEFTAFAKPLDIVIPLLITLAASVLAVLLAALVFRSWRKAGLIVFLFLVAFFAYGHVFEFIIETDWFGFFPQKRFLIGWAIFFAIVGLLALRIRTDLKSITNSLNAITVILVAISVINIIAFHVGKEDAAASDGQRVGNEGELAAGTSGDHKFLPDIYYIVPDAMTSPQNFKNIMGEDMSEFTGYLRSRGFAIDDDARSNYSHTTTSLSSVLNMEHITYMADVMPAGSIDPMVLPELMKEGTVFKFFRSQGYQIIHSREMGWPEHYGDTLFNCVSGVFLSFHADDFSGALIRTTVLEPALKFFKVYASRLQGQNICDFDEIVQAKRIEGPKFVFAHLFVPHPPYIFGRNGEQVAASSATFPYSKERSEVKVQYSDQSVYVATKLQEVVDALLSDPEYEPIILIQADTGTGIVFGEGDNIDVYEERFGIWNAIHLPRGGNEALYDGMTPVNSFRVILNYYFGTDLEMKPDISYYENPTYGKFNFRDVTDQLDALANGN
jgi:hypothetical protein